MTAQYPKTVFDAEHLSRFVLPEAGDCYNEALSAVKGKIIFNSSAGP